MMIIIMIILFIASARGAHLGAAREAEDRILLLSIVIVVVVVVVVVLLLLLLLMYIYIYIYNTESLKWCWRKRRNGKWERT